MCPRGEIGRHKGLKIIALWECKVILAEGTKKGKNSSLDKLMLKLIFYDKKISIANS